MAEKQIAGGGAMSALEIMDELYFIERGYLNANHFVYRAPEPILIDTGYISDFAETRNLLAGVGVNPADVRLIVNTHSHCDHIGGNRIIQAESGCDIALHRVGKHFSDTRDDWSTWWRYLNQEAAFFDSTVALEEGDTITVGPHEFQVFHTPGHASDGIVLYQAQEKILISSDALWESGIPMITVRVEGSRALFMVQESLDKLKSLEVRVVYPGHGPPFADLKAAIARSERRIDTYLQDPGRLGTDTLKKIVIYTLLMRQPFQEDQFFTHLMQMVGFRETVDFYCDGRYEAQYDELLHGFLERGIIKREYGNLVTTIRP
jgi:glyoxylase-like metal-dependent hydrolase (beta-lactamase superfamily II)